MSTLDSPGAAFEAQAPQTQAPQTQAPQSQAPGLVLLADGSVAFEPAEAEALPPQTPVPDAAAPEVPQGATAQRELQQADAASTDARDADLAPLLQGAFAGPVDFAHALRAAFAQAAAQAWSEMVWSDAHFLDWPLGEAAVVRALDDWAHRGRRLTLLAQSYDELALRHPRFVQWRRRWDHLLTCRTCSRVAPTDFPSAIWTPEWALQRLDLVHITGVAGPEPWRRQRLRERLDELLRQSSPGFPASTLGL